MTDIVFKTEDSLWRMMAAPANIGVDTNPRVTLSPDPFGRDAGPGPISAKPFDMRRYDLVDDRIYKLSFGRENGYPSRREQFKVAVDDEARGGRSRYLLPEVEEVGFLNKATGELAVFEYKGMEFAEWAPGWCFLIIGRLLRREP